RWPCREPLHPISSDGCVYTVVVSGLTCRANRSARKRSRDAPHTAVTAVWPMERPRSPGFLDTPLRRECLFDAGRGAPGALTSSEREELQRLRRENRQLEMERDILKKATAFFAKESR